MDHLLQDLRFAVRGFGRHPAYTAAALLTLAGGIGAVTAILSVVNGIIVRPLPYPNATRALLVWTSGRAGTPMAEATMPFSGANFVDLQAQNRFLEYAVAFRSWPMTYAGPQSAELFRGAKVSSGEGIAGEDSRFRGLEVSRRSRGLEVSSSPRLNGVTSRLVQPRSSALRP